MLMRVFDNDESILDRMHAHLRAAEQEQIQAISLIALALARHATERSRGLTTEFTLMLDSRMTGHDARVAVQLAATYRAMPHLARALRHGTISLSQFKEISYEVRAADASVREGIDAMISRDAAALTDADPDHLVCLVRDTIAASRPDLARAREDRAFARNTFRMQMRIDGSSDGSFSFDPETTAVVAQGLDALAPPPVDPEIEDAPSRCEQNVEAVRTAFELALAGGHASTRARPRMIVSCELSGLASDGLSVAARALTAVAGKPPRLTSLTTEMLLCDADIAPVISDAGRPVAVGDSQAQISPKLRAALVARDLGCRFPGCRAPAPWTDAHHLVHRLHGGGTSIDNLALFCRRHHRSIHRYRWRLKMAQDGTIEFRRRGRRYISPPPARRE
jgi:hypothetical protein